MQKGLDGRRPTDEAFEQLWLLRACYVRRSDYDRRSLITVSEAIVYGEQLLRLARVRARWRDYGTTNRAL
jgi:hypothetical protein